MIACIACIDQNYGIGKNNELLVRIPEDMKHFKKLTNNGSIIMGHKTYDTLPKKPLPDRTNIVITTKVKRPKPQKDGSIFSDMEHIKTWLSNENVIKENNGIYVIGGGIIYSQLLPYCERIYLTKVLHSYENVDTYFPNIDNMSEWEMTEESEVKEHNGIKYQFCIYDRVDYKIRNVLTNKENVEINKDDIIVVVDTFNSTKNIIIQYKEKVDIYIDDWEYLNNQNNLINFFNEVATFRKIKGNTNNE